MQIFVFFLFEFDVLQSLLNQSSIFSICNFSLCELLKCSTFATQMSIRKYIPYYKRNLRIAFPVMLTQLGAAIVGLADSIMVGHYSTVDLAAVSFANGIFFTFMVFVMGAMMGITPLVGHSFVRNEDERVGVLLENGLVFAFILSVLTCVILGAVVPFIDMMGQDEQVAAVARPYLITRIIGLFPFIVFCLFKQFFEGLGNTTVAMVITIAMNILNIVLNYLFIYGVSISGEEYIPAMGAYGAGLASLMACLLMPIIFIVVTLSKEQWRKYFRYFSLSHLSKSYFSELARVGFPIGAQTTMETVLFTLSFIMVGWISKEALAAHHIANQVADFAFMLSLGVGSATTIRVAHQYGVRDYKAMRMASRASVHLVLVMNTVGATLMITLRNVLPYLFTDDMNVVEIASPLLVYAGLFQFSDGLQCVGAGMLRGIADVKRPMIYAFIAYVVIALPLGYILMFETGIGVAGMWISFIIALSLAAVFFLSRFRKLARGLQN